MFGVTRASSASERRGGARPRRWRSCSCRESRPAGSSLNLHQLRFLELAKALAGQPRVLLLDEVMAGLNDAELAASVEIVRNVRDELGMAILWVEHVMSAVIQLAERAIVLNFGRLLAEGARGRHARPGGRRRVSRAGTRCLRSSALRPGTSASASSTGSTSRSAPVRRWRSSARTAPARRRSFRAIAGLLPAMEGRVVLDGKDLTRRPAYRISRAGIAYVPAERHLFPAMTLKSNLVLGAYPRRPDRETLELVYDLFPRLRERQRQQAGTLSGGEQQMLAVVVRSWRGRGCSCSTSRRPGWRPRSQIAFEALEGLKQEGMTLLIAEQQVPLALSVADRGYVLENGRILLSGTSQELDRNRRYARTWGSHETCVRCGSRLRRRRPRQRPPEGVRDPGSASADAGSAEQ